ncbi:putative nuclease HARBI1 [Prorops nasuta]|uniref:putative nuclease HARBI1 n=1 Tax=Prorops nasuta TaxID=863751 RepID=UPI0034CF62BE
MEEINYINEFNLNLISSSDSSSDEEYSGSIRRHKRYLRDAINPFESYDERNFKLRYRFSKESTMYGLLPLIEHYLKKPDRRGLPVEPVIQLLITLRYFATNTFQRVSADLVNLQQSTVSYIVFRVTNLLSTYFRKYVKFPTNEREIEENFQLFKELGFGEGAIGLDNVTGAIDCTHIRLSGTQFREHAEVYRNRKSYYSLNVQAVVGPRTEFLDIVPEWPGSNHDSRILKNSRVFHRFQQQEISGILIGDKGYPALPFLLTPFRNPESNEQERYNMIQSRTRMVVERTFGIWKRRFPCLSKGLTLKLSTSTSVITACAVLHNLSLIYDNILPQEETDDDDYDNIVENDDYMENDENENTDMTGAGFLYRDNVEMNLFN